MVKSYHYLSRLLLAAMLLLGIFTLARAETAAEAPQRQSWSWTGAFGKYDRASAQRGLQIYTQVCSACHSLNLVAFRDLAKIGYSEQEIKAFAASYQIDTLSDEGKPIKRKGLPSDYFPKPFATEADARAGNGGALPPDLSLIIKARNHGRDNIFLNIVDALFVQGEASGADYVFALLNGYETAPDGVTLGQGMYYNKYFANHQIAMPKPLNDGAVSYSDGTGNGLPQLAHDVVTFLAFASEPHLEESRFTALKFFIVLAVIYFLVYRMKKNQWKKLHDDE